MDNRIICRIIFILLTAAVKVESNPGSRLRGRASDLDLFISKDGDCPAVDTITPRDSASCNKDCFLDVECADQEKCCQDGCGGTLCHLPAHLVDRCEGFECERQGETCEVLDGQPSCVCRSHCTATAEQVCADDGRVYSSRCWMDVAACEENRSINEVACDGPITPAPEDGPPVMSIGPISFTAEEHQDLTLTCYVDSPSDVSYAWIVTQPGINMEILLPGNDLDNLRVSFDGRELLIASVSAEDAGNYGCLASNSYGFSTLNYKLIVNARRDSPTPVDHRPTTEPTVAPTEPAELPALAPPNELCTQNLDRGHCFRQEVKWFYNLQSQRCEPFMYGGCGGNLNRFRTYEECSQTCPNLPIDPCRHPIVTGHCRARFIRWAYQEESGECVEFVYGGCGANGNNFRTREECGYTCQDRYTKKNECECTRPRLKSSYCRSDFVLSGRIRQEIPSTENGPLLVVQIERLFKRPGNFPLRLGDLAGNVTILRDVSRTPRGCHCVTYTTDGNLIFMGAVTETGEAIINDDSYVVPSNAKRQTKIAELTRCPGDNSAMGRAVEKEGFHPELALGPFEQNFHVERELQPADNFLDVPNYQRKPSRRSRVGRPKKKSRRD